MLASALVPKPVTYLTWVEYFRRSHTVFKATSTRKWPGSVCHGRITSKARWRTFETVTPGKVSSMICSKGGTSSGRNFDKLASWIASIMIRDSSASERLLGQSLKKTITHQWVEQAPTSPLSLLLSLPILNITFHKPTLDMFSFHDIFMMFYVRSPINFSYSHLIFTLQSC